MLKENGEGQAREGVCVSSDQAWDLENGPCDSLPNYLLYSVLQLFVMTV